nr:AAA domain protein [uncultured bacterium]
MDQHGSERATLEMLNSRLRTMLTSRELPLVMAIDGRSGVGKSTLSAAIARDLMPTPVTVIEGDTFFMGGSAETWSSRTIAENADRVIDWRRQRDELKQLLRDGVATWLEFDWDAESWDSDIVPLKTQPLSANAASVVVLEGVYSCRPELQDLIDLKVLLTVPEEVRLAQLLEREGDTDQNGWVSRWSAAEDYYFAHIMPEESFDLVLSLDRTGHNPADKIFAEDDVDQ